MIDMKQLWMFVHKLFLVVISNSMTKAALYNVIFIKIKPIAVDAILFGVLKLVVVYKSVSF